MISIGLRFLDTEIRRAQNRYKKVGFWTKMAKFVFLSTIFLSYMQKVRKVITITYTKVCLDEIYKYLFTLKNSPVINLGLKMVK